jgi:dTDP-4-amino-4,6-dideoxygalactose transaminase
MSRVKASLSDLAVFGGRPAFDNPLHVGAPNIGDRTRLRERINDLLDRRWLSNRGPYVQEFEKRVADLLGVRHCIVTCNATLALEIAIRALDLRGEVIVPAFTFIATAHALQWQEITPVFCDIDPRTYTLDPDRVTDMITPRTTGILGVHLWGRPCDVESFAALARAYHLKLLFDARHAFGGTHRGRRIGSFGDAEVFSFHATEFLNTFEGGAITTNNDALATRARLMTNFGFVEYDKVIHVGTNGKMNEMSAAMGLTSLESMDAFIAVNARNYRQYREAVAQLPGVVLLAHDESECCNYQNVVVEIAPRITGISRDDLVRILHAEGVLARRYFYPGCHRMEPYRSYFPHAGLLLPETEKLATRVLSLPTGTAIGPEQIATTCQILEFVVRHGAEVSAALQAVRERATL